MEFCPLQLFSNVLKKQLNFCSLQPFSNIPTATELRTRIGFINDTIHMRGLGNMKAKMEIRRFCTSHSASNSTLFTLCNCLWPYCNCVWIPDIVQRLHIIQTFGNCFAMSQMHKLCFPFFILFKLIKIEIISLSLEAWPGERFQAEIYDVPEA